jgi:hypothetical protein
VTVCDSWNYFWTSVAEHFSEGDPTGEAQRALLNSTAGQLNDFGSAGAFESANGEGYDSLTPAQKARGDKEFFQGMVSGAAVTNSGAADCENGQRGELSHATSFGPKNDLEGNPFHTANDPHTPGVQGPTYAGLSRVPPGETFTRDNQTGIKLTPQQSTGVYGG